MTGLELSPPLRALLHSYRRIKFGFKCALDNGKNDESNIVLADAIKVYGEVELYSPHTFITINL
jgi:hypothetical protein